MDRLLSILLGIAILYVFYALGIKKWDYTSQAKRDKEKERLKKAGLSTRYYFIPEKRLLLFNITSGGLFLFYWSFKQWQAVTAGFKNTDGTSLKYPPWLRAVCTFISFYQLNAIINRTCRYMRKRPTLSPAFWGTALWTGFAAVWVPALPAGGRITGALFFILAPYVLQRRINALPKELPPTRVKLPEILCLLFCWAALAGIWLLCKRLGLM